MLTIVAYFSFTTAATTNLIYDSLSDDSFPDNYLVSKFTCKNYEIFINNQCISYNGLVISASSTPVIINNNSLNKKDLQYLKSFTLTLFAKINFDTTFEYSKLIEFNSLSIKISSAYI